MTPAAWIQLLVVAVLGTVAQIALKSALHRAPAAGGHSHPVRSLVQSPLLLLWFACYVASTLLWLWALRTVPLSQAFPILGLQFALVPLASSRFLGERLRGKQWLGVGLIVAGVALVGRA